MTMRFEIPLAVWYTHDRAPVTIGAHSIDTAWPWWAPALPDAPMGERAQAVLPLENNDDARATTP